MRGVVRMPLPAMAHLFALKWPSLSVFYHVDLDYAGIVSSKVTFQTLQGISFNLN